MVANPFNGGSPKRAVPRPAPVRPNRPSNPTRRRPLPRVEPLRPRPPSPVPTPPPGTRPLRPSPLFPYKRPPPVPFGRPAIMPPVPSMSWKLARFGLRALPWLNLALTAYDLYLLYLAWNEPQGNKHDCYRVRPGMAQSWYWSPHQHCYDDALSAQLQREWSLGTPVLRHSQRWHPTLGGLEPIEWFGPYSENPDIDLPENPWELPGPVAAPIPPLEVPFPFPFAPMPSPNVPSFPTRPGEEHGPGIRPRPDNPLLPEVLPPAMPPGEPGPGVQPEPGTPSVPIGRPLPPVRWPTPYDPWPNLPRPEFPHWPEQPPAPNRPGPTPGPNGPGPTPGKPTPGKPTPGKPTIPSIDLSPGSTDAIPNGVVPAPGWHFRVPPEQEQERKRKFTGKGSREWMQFLEKLGGSYMEVDDYVGALYKGIPWKYRRWRGKDGVWRDRDITSVDRARRIGEYFNQYNIAAGLKELAQMYVTDKAFGKVGTALKRKTAELGQENLWSGARGTGADVPLNRQDEEARKKLVRERYEANKKDRYYYKTDYLETGGFFRRKVSRPDTEIPWFRRGTRHKGSAATGQTYNRRGRGNSYYASNRG